MARETADSDRGASGKRMLMDARSRIDKEQANIDRQRKAAVGLPPDRRARSERGLAVAEAQLAERRKSLGDVVRAYVDE